MSNYGAVVIAGVRALALIGILPGAIVAGAYVLVLSGQLYHHWDTRTAIVLSMAAWGVLGVLELWHEYVRSSQNHAGVRRTTVNPRVLLFVWALILVAVAGWKVDERPWIAAFLALVGLYSFARASGLLRYFTRSAASSGASSGASVAPAAPGARARGGGRSRIRKVSGVRRARFHNESRT